MKRKAIGLTFVYYSATKKREKKRKKLLSPSEGETNGRASQESALGKAGLGTEVGDVRIESRSIGSSVFVRLLKGTTAQGSSSFFFLSFLFLPF